MQRLDLMQENSPLESWWLSTNNPNQPSLTPLHKEPNFILSRYICFGKVSVKLNVVQSMLLAVNFLAESLLACSKVTSPALPFMLGLNHQRVAAALCWYHSRKTSERLQRVPEQCHVLPACQSPWQSCLPVAGSLQECCSRHVSILSMSFAICLPCPVFSPGPTPGWAGSRQWKGLAAAVPPPKSKNWVLAVLQSGGDSEATEEVEERHRTLVRLASCSRLAEPCLAEERVKWHQVKGVPCIYRQKIIWKLKPSINARNNGI